MPAVCGRVQHEKDRAAHVQIGTRQASEPRSCHARDDSVLYLRDIPVTEAPIRRNLIPEGPPELFRTKYTSSQKQTLAERYDEGLSVV